VRYHRLLFLLTFFIADSTFAQGNIRGVLAPVEIPAGEQFTVIVAGNPVSREQNRMIAIQFPESWKIVSAYAAEDGATESTPISQYPEMVSYFEKEKGLSVKIFEDRTHIYSEHNEGIAYFFVFSAPNITSTGNFKACFIERADAGSPPAKEKPKGKKSKQPVRVKNYEWRIVSPSLGSNFSFSEVSGKKYSRTVRFISGWRNISRALILSDSLDASAQLHLRPELLRSFFDNQFTLEWWMRAVSGGQTIFKFLCPDSVSGLTISANPFGQIVVSRFPLKSDSDIATLSGVISCDGAWHHIALSCDLSGTLRIFVDGELNDTTAKASNFFKDLSFCTIGEPKIPEYFSIDELHFLRHALAQSEDIPDIAVAARDTISDALALFHFEEFGNEARSSVYTILRAKDSLSHPITEAIYFTLNSGARLGESSSPVLLDRGSLSVEQSSATKITFNWRATSEYGVKRYELQRRIATFGEYEKTLSVPAKRTIDPNEEDRSLIARASYSAAEKLPQLTHDIDLYYRLALIGNNDSVLHYTEPVKLEFGGARDVFVEQNKPNPFNPKTTIAFRLTKKTNVQIAVYDIIGREVFLLFDGKLSAGKHSIDIDASNWPGGIYFYKVKTSKTIVTKKMVLAK
jgi:hypothetical protein